VRTGSSGRPDLPSDHVTPYDRFAWNDTEVERLLATGEHQRELIAYFGVQEHTELARLAHKAASTSNTSDTRVLVVPGIMGSQLGMRRPAPLPDDVLWVDPIDIELGRLDAARSIVDWFADSPTHLVHDWLWLSAIGHLADCCADLAFLNTPMPEASAHLYRLLEPYVDRCIVLAHGVLCTGAAARQLGGLAAALGRHDEAIKYLEAATVTTREQRAVPWTARAQLAHADVLIRRNAPGDAESAAALKREADAAIAIIGAEGLAWRSRLLGERLRQTRDSA